MATMRKGRGSTGMRSRSGWHHTGTTSKGSIKTRKTGKRPVAGYESCFNGFSNKISSFKTLSAQTVGAAKYRRPPATTLNTFANWVNKGAIVHTVSCAQVGRWARTTKKSFNTRNATPVACKTVLCNKFGKTTIKAVARTKTGSFMVATVPTWQGKPFCFSC